MVNDNQTEIMKEIFEIARSISSILDVDTLLKRIDAAAEKLLSAEASSIMLLSEDKQSLLFKVASGEKGGIIQKMKIKVGEGIAGWVAKEKKPIVVDDCSNDPRFTGRTDRESGFKTKSLICVPMFVENELVGVMEVLNKQGGTCFTEVDLKALESMASLAAVSISNARMAEDQRNFFVNVIEIMVNAVEIREPKFAGHSWKVAQLATALARNLQIEGQDFKDIYYGALMHNIGLLFIKDEVSFNQGGITLRNNTPETNYPKIGAEMVRSIKLLAGAAKVIRHHRENFDGTGFPEGLSGENIPIGSRIVAVAVAVEEMRLNGFPEDRIRQLLKLGQETRFDPQIVGLYLKDNA